MAAGGMSLGMVRRREGHRRMCTERYCKDYGKVRDKEGPEIGQSGYQKWIQQEILTQNVSNVLVAGVEESER